MTCMIAVLAQGGMNGERHGSAPGGWISVGADLASVGGLPGRYRGQSPAPATAASSQPLTDEIRYTARLDGRRNAANSHTNIPNEDQPVLADTSRASEYQSEHQYNTSDFDCHTPRTEDAKPSPGRYRDRNTSE